MALDYTKYLKKNQTAQDVVYSVIKKKKPEDQAKRQAEMAVQAKPSQHVFNPKSETNASYTNFLDQNAPENQPWYKKAWDVTKGVFTKSNLKTTGEQMLGLDNNAQPLKTFAQGASIPSSLPTIAADVVTKSVTAPVAISKNPKLGLNWQGIKQAYQQAPNLVDVSADLWSNPAKDLDNKLTLFGHRPSELAAGAGGFTGELLRQGLGMFLLSNLGSKISTKGLTKTLTPQEVALQAENPNLPPQFRATLKGLADNNIGLKGEGRLPVGGTRQLVGEAIGGTGKSSGKVKFVRFAPDGTTTEVPLKQIDGIIKPNALQITPKGGPVLSGVRPVSGVPEMPGILRTATGQPYVPKIQEQNLTLKTGNEPTQAVVPDRVVQVISPTGEKTYYTIPQSESKTIIDKIDNSGGMVVQNKQGTFHVTAKTPSQMELQGFKNGGLITADKIPDIKIAKPVVEKPQGQTAGVAKSIEAKAIEQGLIDKGFDELAQFEGSTFKEQAQKVADLMRTDMEKVKSIIRGQEPLPADIRSAGLLSAMEDFAKLTKDSGLMYDLANSPLTSNISESASELSFTRMRTKDSATMKLQEIKKAKEKKAELRKSKQFRETAKSIKKEVNKVNLSKEDLDWENFLEDIKC